LGGDGEIAFVLTIRRVDDHDELAVAEVFDRLVDGRERRFRTGRHRVHRIQAKAEGRQHPWYPYGPGDDSRSAWDTPGTQSPGGSG
jgi:hypothetical protein